MLEIGGGEIPPDDGAIGSAGVESGWLIKYSGGCDSVKRWRV